MHIKHDFKKKFGQNFLKTGRYPSILVNSLELKTDDFVIEIGPGDGAVTEKVLQTGAKLMSVEVDYDLLTKILKRIGDNPNFDLVHSDILEFDLESEIAKRWSGSSIKVVGSLPYNISKKIIEKFFTFNLLNKSNIHVEKMAFIVQDEVAKDYVSTAPKASFLANYSRLQSKIKKLESIPASQFYPKPKVDGGILLFEPFLKNDIPNNISEIIRIMRIGFSSPRKTLRNNLMGNKDLEADKIDSALVTCEIKEKARPAELTIDQWTRLTSLL